MLKRALAIVGITSALVIACGSDGSDSQFGSSGGSGTDGTSGGTGFGSSGSSGASGGASGGLVGPACATSSANGQAEPVYLVLMVDRSGSMKQNGPQPPGTTKWDVVLSGLKQFLSDSASAGLFASEQVFPLNDECNSNAYSAPLVAVTALPDTANALYNALASNGPQGNFGTPTKPAVTGAVSYAQSLVASGKKSTVVLVTDGDPNDCNSDPNNSGQAAGGGLPNVRTYVIGVGDSLANLNTIASGGGTNQAIIVSPSDPAKLKTDFINALNLIRQAALSCDYALPAPPSGETLDINKVNVQYTPQGGTVQTLDYNADCTNGTGWHYDNPSTPTKILICPGSCNTLLANANGKIDILFGCATQGGVPH